jgi:hypothetical protein
MGSNNDTSIALPKKSTTDTSDMQRVIQEKGTQKVVKRENEFVDRCSASVVRCKLWISDNRGSAAL